MLIPRHRELHLACAQGARRVEDPRLRGRWVDDDQEVQFPQMRETCADALPELASERNSLECALELRRDAVLRARLEDVRAHVPSHARAPRERVELSEKAWVREDVDVVVEKLFGGFLECTCCTCEHGECMVRRC